MKCKICENENATQYNHYGSVQVCQSCRMFFTRSVKNSMFKIFKHNFKTGCIIDSKNRKSCKKCRFDKCLDEGMKVSFVIGQKPCPKKELLFENLLTMDEEYHLKNLYRLVFDAASECTYQIMESDISLAYLILEGIPTKQRLTDENLCLIDRIDRLSSLKMYQALGNENQLQDIIHTLADFNYGRIVTFFYFAFFGGRNETDQLKGFIRYGRQSRKASDNVNIIVDLAEKSLKRDNLVLYEYEAFYDSPWAADLSTEEEHKSIFMVSIIKAYPDFTTTFEHLQKVREWFDKSIKPSEPGEIDCCLVILMLQILLFHTDGLELTEAKRLQVEKIQQLSVQMLFKYLKSHLSREVSYSQLHQALMLVSDSQRAYELSQKRLQLDMTDAEESLDLLSL